LRLASASSDQTVKIWDATTSQEARTLTRGGGCVAFSPDGKRLASGGLDTVANEQGNLVSGVKVSDAQTGKELLVLRGHLGGIRGVAFSPDGKLLASCDMGRQKGGTVKVWDAQTGRELLSLQGHTNWVFGVAFSPDGKRLASASRDATVKVWDTQT